MSECSRTSPAPCASSHANPVPENVRTSSSKNRDFYDILWSESTLIRPERFNTWPLISALLPRVTGRLEIGPGLRPRLPISGSCFVDISPPVVDSLEACGGIAVSGEITNLPFGDSAFELACAFDVIEHAEDDRLVFSEVSRVLKEGGYFIFSVPLYTRLWTKFDAFVGHVRRYEPADLPGLLEAHGLILERSAAYGMQPSNPRLLDFGLKLLEERRKQAMWWYNKILMPLGMLFQRRLNFIDGLIDMPGVDEIVLVCRKQTGPLPQSCRDRTGSMRSSRSM